MDLVDMDNDDILLEAVKCAAVVISDEVVAEEEQQRTRRKRSCWTTDWLLKRPVEGACAKLFAEWERGQPIERKLYDSCRRMNEENFATLHGKVGPLIQKQETMMRKPISTEIRLGSLVAWDTTLPVESEPPSSSK